MTHPLLWLSEVITPESVEIARYLLSVLEDCVPNGSSSKFVASILNGVSDQTTAEMPNALTNPLMRAAKAGNMEMVKVFLKYGAEAYVDRNHYGSHPTFKNAATYAYEAKFFDVAFELDPEGTGERLQEEFTRRCETTSIVEYMSDYNLLLDAYDAKETLSMYGDGKYTLDDLSDNDLDKLAGKMLHGILNDIHRFHKYYGTQANVYSVESHKLDLIPLSKVEERSLFIESDIDDENSKYPISKVIDRLDKIDSDKTKVEIDFVKKQIEELNALTRDNKLFLSTPYGQVLGEQRTLLVKLIEDKPILEVRQMAFDHYMSRIDLFSRIARLSVARPDTFDAFTSIIRTSRIYNCGAFCDVVMLAFFEGMRDVTGQDEFILYKVMIMIDTLSASKDMNPKSDAHYYDKQISLLDDLIKNFFP